MININVKYKNLSKLFSCSSRREFGHTVPKYFGLDKNDVQMFDISSNSLELITLNDLKDQMQVEIKKKGVKTSKPNGERFERIEDTPVNVKVPDMNELKKKLQENRVLSGFERKFLLDLISDFDSISQESRKRKRGLEQDTPFPSKETANKKVQVDVNNSTKQSCYTQTDNLRTHDPDQPTTSNDLIFESKRLSCVEKKDMVKVRQLMNDTYEDRRQFILIKNPVLTLVREKYPLLFSTEEVRNELNRIFYDNKDVEFLLNLEKCSSEILNLVGEDNPLLKKINNAVKTAPSKKHKNYAKQVGAILMISNILREKRTYINTEDEPCEKNNYPRIEAPCEVSQLFEDINTYKIIVEGLVLCEASTFPEAVLCLLSCYFIFNISYPDHTFNTFVVMEKIFLAANDTESSEIDEQTSQIIRLIKLKTNS